ncbi:FBP domain-containing protein [Streptomyces rimosus subsp. pseudoverticillatus]|uniref:FBP domain-containing protein n=1 Tax=Streptomyces rimosus TaxID=1927 RepID=UPI0006B2889D|nr:FBP domain-containing protein [Streptomyces rimosus]KOT95516.1 FBP domain-containing protein [Streptomyces rimosus subsp. pseudoverticillatus]
MDPLDEKRIRTSFINCSKGEASRINLPANLSALPWDDLDFLGWRDPGAPDRSYLVAPRAGGIVGVTLRVPQGVRRSFTKTTVCSLCLTGHPGSGVSLLAARKAGALGRQGNTVGTYICADLACSLYVRGKKKSELAGRHEESLPLEDRIARMVGNLDAFVDKVFEGE